MQIQPGGGVKFFCTSLLIQHDTDLDILQSFGMTRKNSDLLSRHDGDGDPKDSSNLMTLQAIDGISFCSG